MNARLNPFFNATPPGGRNSITFPHGFLDFLNVSPGRRHRVGDYELEPERLETFNCALRALSPEAPGISMDQIATAAQRALHRHVQGTTPPFVESRMVSLARLERMAEDQAWGCNEACRHQVSVLRAYRKDDHDLIPDGQPVVGLLDDAVLVDVALHLLRDELGNYEDFCRFRKVAAEYSGLTEAETGLTREHWIEAMIQARQSIGRLNAPSRDCYIADPRASLFHIG
ncbi:MAG: YkvA family protein [Pseudomonadota bacterium]